MLNKILKKSKNITFAKSKSKSETQYMDIATYVKFLNANDIFKVFLFKCELHSEKYPEFRTAEEFMRELNNIRDIYENIYKNKKISNEKIKKNIINKMMLYLTIILTIFLIIESTLLIKIIQ